MLPLPMIKRVKENQKDLHPGKRWALSVIGQLGLISHVKHIIENLGGITTS